MYAGLGVSELRRLKQLEDENASLKRLVADLVPGTTPKSSVAKNSPSVQQVTLVKSRGPALIDAANAFSNSRVAVPLPIQFEAKTSLSAASSSPPRQGWKMLIIGEVSSVRTNQRHG